jgi:hypothetical protein
MFPLNTIIAWNINIIMNKKYNNNNIIIASRAYFLQFGSPVLLDWALPTPYEKGLSALPEREARIELRYSAGLESPEKSPASPRMGSSPTGVSAAPSHFPLLQTLSLLSPRTKTKHCTPAAVAHRFDAGHSCRTPSWAAAAGHRRGPPSIFAAAAGCRPPPLPFLRSRTMPKLQDAGLLCYRTPPPLLDAATGRRPPPLQDVSFLRSRMPTRAIAAGHRRGPPLQDAGAGRLRRYGTTRQVALPRRRRRLASRQAT